MYHDLLTLYHKYLKYKFVRYAIVGGINTILDTVLLVFFVEIVGLTPTLGKVCSMSIAIVNGYYWNRVWTFRHAEPRVFRQFVLFLGINAGGIALALLTIYFFVNIAGIWYVIANILAAFIGLMWNFNINRRYTFK